MFPIEIAACMYFASLHITHRVKLTWNISCIVLGDKRIYCNWHSLLISSRVFCVSMISSDDVRCRCIHLWTRPQKCWEIRFCLEPNIWVASDRCMQMEIHGNHLFRVSFLQVLPWILFGTILPFLRRYSIPFGLVRQTKD